MSDIYGNGVRMWCYSEAVELVSTRHSQQVTNDVHGFGFPRRVSDRVMLLPTTRSNLLLYIPSISPGDSLAVVLERMRQNPVGKSYRPRKAVPSLENPSTDRCEAAGKSKSRVRVRKS